MASTIVDPNEIQRLRYMPGQDLLSRDFRDQAAYEEQLRWWHNRSVHEAYGVRYGLEVSVAAAAAEPAVEVTRGLAYDGFGRELILPAARTVRVPAGPEPRLLVIRRRLEGSACSAADLAGVCLGDPAPRGADLAWLAAGELRPADGVPLARVIYSDGEPALDDNFHAPASRPLARPRLGRGSTVAGATAWRPWSFRLRPRFLAPGLEVRIDTRAAGFTRRPCYFAWLQGAIPFGKTGVYLPVFQWIERSEEDPRGFLFRLLFPIPLPVEGQATATLRRLLLLLAQRELSVCWLGIQMQADHPVQSEVTHGHS